MSPFRLPLSSPPPYDGGMRHFASIAALLCLTLGSGAMSAPSITAEVVRQLTGIDDEGAITDGVVTALAQDATGYLWIGSPGGLARFDGYRFRRFTHAHDDPHSLGGNFVRSLLVARDGRLWIGTESDGLSMFDPTTDRFTRFQHRPGDPTSLQSGGVRALVEDTAGRIWIGTIGGGLSWLDPAQSRFTRVELPHDRLGMAETRVSALLVTPGNALWIGTWNGLAVLPAGSASATWATFSPGDAIGMDGRNIPTLFQARDGRIWAGTAGGDVVVFDALLGKPLNRFRVDGDVTAIAQSTGNEIWIGHGAGIDTFDAAATRRLEALRHVPGDPNALTTAMVSALWLDPAGWIWIGSAGGGVQRLFLRDTAFALRRARLPGPTQAVFNITSVVELADGQIWLGTASDGILAFDDQFALRDRIRPGSADNAGNASAQLYIASLAQGPDGIVWAGTPNGLHGINTNGEQVRAFDSATWLGNARVRRLYTSGDGRLWIGSNDGVFLLPQGGDRIEPVRALDGAAAHLSVNAFAQDADGSIWVGTAQGLYVIDEGAPALRAVASSPGMEPAHASVLGLLLDSQQKLWLDTPEGLHRVSSWDGSHAVFERVSERLGVGGQPAGANLLEDGRGRIWTHKMVIDLARDRAYSLSAADGFDLGTGWFRSYAKRRDGSMLFGGSKGLLVVNPRKYRPWSYSPLLVASELRVNGKPRPASALPRTGLTLSPGERSFSVEFAALDLSAPLANRYTYRLEGFDPDWIEVDARRRTASYSNLWPGSYVLKARGSNRIGAWSPHQLEIAITVLPAWWQTWWFALLLLSLVVGLMMLVVRARTASLARYRSRLEREVRERTQALQSVSQQLEIKSAALEQASLSDPLTGLRNRRFLTQHLAADIALCLRRFESGGDAAETSADDADMVFFLVDIDHFKRVNDVHGHAAGDAMLVEVARRLLMVFRESDYIVRWGGEEFLVVARGSSRRCAAQLAERVRERMAGTPFTLPTGATIQGTCSIGFAAFPPDPARPRAARWECAVEFADVAMYSAKHAGRNGWVGIATMPMLDTARYCDGSREALQADIASGTIAVQTCFPQSCFPDEHQRR